jgi:integrase/recombinase XerD
VSSCVEELSQDHAALTVKLHLAALRMLFDWLVVQQVMPANPAHPVHGPKHSVKKGKTPVLNVEETRELLDAIETDTLIGLRDRALIGLMVYAFARVGAAVKMRVDDYFVQGRKGWVRLHEKGSKHTSLPCHHLLHEYLEEYINKDGPGERAEGPAVPDGRIEERQLVYRSRYVPAGCSRHDPAPRRGRRHQDEDRVPHLPRHRHHGLSQERRAS